MDAEVYVFLAKKGQHNVIDISEKLGLKTKQLENILKNLLGKEIVTIKSNYPNEFAAIPFEETLILLIEIRKKQAEILNETRKEFISRKNKTEKSPKNDHN